ncbi:Uracil-DNA glycosylase [Chromobacterium violaceum]|uniref:Uracil-DNA glycosylase n=1 Tax=Chromobacterium violaceum TaxID=536 RepID=A0A447T4W6_CHRVL|nr:Uracil-DNA glycosylase [Chromobacterium violaceum]
MFCFGTNRATAIPSHVNRLAIRRKEPDMPSLTYLAPALARIHPDWEAVLDQAAVAARLAEIDRLLVLQQQDGKTLFPPPPQVFNALAFAAPADVKVVILGQDPYHGDGEAMGLSFSVPDGARVPPSLRNIYKELAADLGLGVPASGDLTHWAQQGVLLLNSVLTVERDKAGSHGKLGWQTVSDALIDAVNRDNPAACSCCGATGRRPRPSASTPPPPGADRRPPVAAVGQPRFPRLPPLLPGQRLADRPRPPAGALGDGPRRAKLPVLNPILRRAALRGGRLALS